jgi:hypothetical protein
LVLSKNSSLSSSESWIFYCTIPWSRAFSSFSSLIWATILSSSLFINSSFSLIFLSKFFSSPAIFELSNDSSSFYLKASLFFKSWDRYDFLPSSFFKLYWCFWLRFSFFIESKFIRSSSLKSLSFWNYLIWSSSEKLSPQPSDLIYLIYSLLKFCLSKSWALIFSIF